MYKIFFMFLLSSLLQAQVYDGVAIVVGDKAITLLDIKNEMKNAHIDAKKAADILIRKKLEKIEIANRKISVSSSEVYDDIKKMASRNHMNISAFYDAVLESNGVSSEELKKRVKERLLSGKLYQAIAYSSLNEPSQEEIQEYYNLHKKEYKHPSSFTVIIYNSKDRNVLQTKVDNPMFYSPEIQTKEQTLPYNKISPKLAKLLAQTSVDTFTHIVPDGKGGFMSFYLKEVTSAQEDGVKAFRGEIINTIMAKRREQVLRDYFTRLKQNADINVIREVK